ncbi:MAG: hypothetical protein ACTHKQ_07795 [Mesorhizobium sp.]
MRISVQPAKRNDRTKIIFDCPLTTDAVQLGAHGAASILLVASDLYNSGSRFRYTFDLEAEDVRLLVSLLT